MAFAAFILSWQKSNESLNIPIQTNKSKELEGTLFSIFHKKADLATKH